MHLEWPWESPSQFPTTKLKIREKEVLVTIGNQTQDQVWSKEIHPSVYITLPQSNKARLHSNQPKEVKILSILRNLFKIKLKSFGKPLKEIQGKTTKTKQGVLKDKQEKHKNQGKLNSKERDYM